MKRLALILALAIAAQGSLVSLADAAPAGGGARGGGGARSAPMPQPQRQAPQRQAPQGNRSGFNVPSSDYKSPSNPQPNRNTANNNANRNNANNNANRNNNNNNGNRNNNNNNVNRNNNNNTVNRNNGNTYNRTVINNPVYYGGGSWGWNHGVAWAPAYGYYGGGFWGALAIGVTSAAVGAAIYGSMVGPNNVTYTSYQVQPSSPGSTLLANYQLQQVQCGPPGLVVIYGPNNSVICANPNNLVAAGTYNLDTETLSLTNA